MKEYLKKLGSRKFQSLLGALAVNGLSFYLFVTGTVEIDDIVNRWMPTINLVAGTVTTIVYIVIEGLKDKAAAENGKEQSDDFETPIEPRL